MNRILSLKTYTAAFFIMCTLGLSGCGGGAGSSNSGSGTNTPTAAEVAAITPAQIATYNNAQIVNLGTNIKYLSDASLAALTYVVTAGVPTGSGLVGAITVEQIAVLSPAQVRMIGAAGPGGSYTTSQITQLNSGAWAALVSDPAQVAAITAAEAATLTGTQITDMGTNIKYLTDAALNALTPWTAGRITIGQIEAISVTQIAVLTPAQVRMIGAAGPGGSITTSMITWLNSGTWAALVSDPAQAAAITAAEIVTLGYAQIVAMGTSLQYLSDAAMGAIGVYSSASTKFQYGQLEELSVAQIMVLSPAQISILANSPSPYGAGTGIAYMNIGAFGALSATQVAVLTPSEVIGVSAAMWASLSDAALAGLSPATIASLSVTQKALLSSAQHTACGC